MNVRIFKKHKVKITGTADIVPIMWEILCNITTRIVYNKGLDMNTVLL